WSAACGPCPGCAAPSPKGPSTRSWTCGSCCSGPPGSTRTWTWPRNCWSRAGWRSCRDPVSAGRVLYVSPTPRPWRRSTRDSTGWNRSCGAWPAAAERAAGYSRPVERGGPAVDWRGRRVAVVGLGRETVPLARYLTARGARVTGFDRQDPGDLPAPARALAALGVRLIGGPGYLEELAAGDFE